jgi:hypothetical protein
MNDQTEAEREAAEKDAAQRAATEKRTAEVNAGMNRLLRGQPSVEQDERAKRLNEKTRKRLEEIARDEDSPEDAAWALRVLSGEEPLMNEKKRPVSADGGAGLNSPARERDPGDAFNDMIREARYPHLVRPWWIP